MSTYPAKTLITIFVNRQLAKPVLETLSGAGLNRVYIEAGRSSMLEEKDTVFSLGKGKKMGNDPVEVISFFISKDIEDDVMHYIAIKYDFNAPGRGSIFSNEVGWVMAHPLCLENTAANIYSNEKVSMFDELGGICCIVQRGNGDQIARICLDSGASVPITTYGTGSGFRDKIGLLRITIPAEKELINIVMSKYDIDSVMELMIMAGKLDEPGKGFIYTYPIKQGIVDTKISRGKTGQVASMEQVVSAIDSIKGGMEWRSSRLESETSKKRVFLNDFLSTVELSLICNEGYSIPLMKAAMESGAAGATISKLKYVSSGGDDDKIPATREICKMIVGENQVSPVAEAIKNAGGFTDEMHGLLYTLAVPKAFTYLAK